jgi:cell division protease FtsH
LITGRRKKVFGGRFRNIFVYLIIMVAAAFLFFNFSSQSEKVKETPISQVAAEAKAGMIEQITVTGDYSTLEVEFKDRREPAVSRMGDGVDVVEVLRNLGVSEEEIAAITIEYQQPSGWASWLPLLSGILPAILFMVLFYFLLRQAQGSNSQALSFGKSRARMFSGDQPTVTFEDVAGVKEAKEELYEVVEFLKEPEKFIALGARIPKGVLLVGAPGTGKTLMAKAVSGEAGVPFFNISGSEFVEMFVGVGASRVRDLFDQAKRHSPCIIFIDEIDAVGRHRGAGLGGSHDEREQTLNQILVEMDGFDTDTNVIILAASNRPDILDPALLRPGRFDRRVVLDIPDIKGREGILDVHVRGKPLANDIDLEILARRTPGFVGADIENMVNEAAILAARRDKKVIGMEEFGEAIERVVAGPERKSRIISDEEKEIIAYHEAGHAMVMGKLPHCDPVHKVSIVSRGMALGYTMPLPEEDRYLKHRAKFKDQLAGLLGGRAAEELVFNDVTTGAASDLMQATKLARKMVCEYGMSENLGPMTFGQKQELVFLGREISEQRDYGEQVAQEIDREVRGFIDEAYSRAKEILTTYRDRLIVVAQRLVEDETLEGSELEAMLA